MFTYMKKIFTAILLLALFSAFVFPQNSKPVDYTQKIKEATPKALPQTPAAAMQTSDAQNENLKGKIKLITVETQSADDARKLSAKIMSSIIDFDSQGRYLRVIYFDSRGRPRQISVYGFIDGTRASLTNYIKNDDVFYNVAEPDEKNKVKPKPDPRYTYKYEFKYAGGKLIDKQMFLNTGEKGMSYVYNYQGNQREYLAYTGDDELNQKIVYQLDNRGNEIEQRSYDIRVEPEIVSVIYRYKYETFDKQGNWTKRTMSKVTTEKDKEAEELIAVEYRTITYYP